MRNHSPHHPQTNGHHNHVTKAMKLSSSSAHPQQYRVFQNEKYALRCTVAILLLFCVLRELVLTGKSSQMMMMIIPQLEEQHGDQSPKTNDCTHSSTKSEDEDSVGEAPYGVNQQQLQQRHQETTKSTSPTTRQFYYKSDYETIEKKKNAVVVNGDVNSLVTTTTPTDFHGVKVRAWSKRTTDPPIPCLKKNDNGHGLVFIKPMKTGSSTAAGVNLRIAHNEGYRQWKLKRQAINDTKKISFFPCKSLWDHQFASNIFKNDYNKDDNGEEGQAVVVDDDDSNVVVDTSKTYLWSVIRDPTSRLVSQFFHFHVSRGKKEPTDTEFQKFTSKFINEGLHSRQDHYLHWLSTRGKVEDRSKTMDNNNNNTTTITNEYYYINVLNQIMMDYDFFAVTERMDESMVALSMLMNIPLSDVLYLKAKGHGSWDDGGAVKGNGKHICIYIVPSFISNGMYTYFNTDEFQDLVYYDHILHQVVNASLDYTIDTVLGGREVFNVQLERYKRALQLVKDKCYERTVFPCSQVGENGGQRKHPDKTDCLASDSGCGHDCMNQVASVYLK